MTLWPDSLRGCVTYSLVEINFYVLSENELIQKYGQGEMVEALCMQCGYATEVLSAGVHQNGGNIQVFAQEEEMLCPHCGPTDAMDEFQDVPAEEGQTVEEVQEEDMQEEEVQEEGRDTSLPAAESTRLSEEPMLSLSLNYTPP